MLRSVLNDVERQRRRTCSSRLGVSIAHVSGNIGAIRYYLFWIIYD